MSITYHVCKYTPTELLTALGGQCALLDEAPENFDLSDQVAHPNLCGFGKRFRKRAEEPACHSAE